MLHREERISNPSCIPGLEPPAVIGLSLPAAGRGGADGDERSRQGVLHVDDAEGHHLTPPLRLPAEPPAERTEEEHTDQALCYPEHSRNLYPALPHPVTIGLLIV